MWQKYVIIGGIILFLMASCYAMWQRGQTYKAKYKGEVEKVAQRDATIKSVTATATIQRTADAKALASTQGLLKECLDNQPVCPPPQIICEGGKCNVTVEPAEAPF